MDYRVDGHPFIWNAYNQFLDDMTRQLLEEGYELKDINNLMREDFMKFAKDWIDHFRKYQYFNS